ncbi:NAD(+) synthase, partial [Campylobacter jejuni]
LKNSLVIGTSNKSELLLGYGTIYGDLACAFNPIGSLYKSEIYALAKYLNLHENFIKKAPSADLWENQSDEGDLGFSYAKIDEGLKALETNDEKLLRTLDPSLIAMLKNRMQKNAFKGKMPEILEI